MFTLIGKQIAESETYQRSSALPEGVTDADPARFTVAIERPLSAEQILRSVLEATGERARLEPATPGEKPPEAKVEPALPAYADLQKKFTVAFANAPRDPEVDFAPALKGALFLMNNDTFLSLLSRRPGNLVDRCVALKDDPAKLAEELYLSALTRRPDETETADVAAYLAKHQADLEKSIERLAWALLTSTENYANH